MDTRDVVDWLVVVIMFGLPVVLLVAYLRRPRKLRPSYPLVPDELPRPAFVKWRRYSTRRWADGRLHRDGEQVVLAGRDKTIVFQTAVRNLKILAVGGYEFKLQLGDAAFAIRPKASSLSYAGGHDKIAVRHRVMDEWTTYLREHCQPAPVEVSAPPAPPAVAP